MLLPGGWSNDAALDENSMGGAVAAPRVPSSVERGEHASATAIRDSPAHAAYESSAYVHVLATPTVYCPRGAWYARACA